MTTLRSDDYFNFDHCPLANPSLPVEQLPKLTILGEISPGAIVTVAVEGNPNLSSQSSLVFFDGLDTIDVPINPNNTVVVPSFNPPNDRIIIAQAINLSFGKRANLPSGGAVRRSRTQGRGKENATQV